MRKELDEQLCARYPLIFRDRYADPRRTCMYWGLDVGDGWYNIIDALCAGIQQHIDNSIRITELANKFNTELEEAAKDNFENWDSWKSREPREIPEPIEQVVAIQVKEKFGDLRFYYSGGDDYIRGMVDMAEYMSRRTCEVCGSPGVPRGGGWIKVLCDEHAK